MSAHQTPSREVGHRRSLLRGAGLAVSSMVLALVGAIVAWVSAYGTPRAARAAAVAGDYANIFTFLFLTLGVAGALHLVALLLGIRAARQSTVQKGHLLLAGAGIALSATGLIGIAVTLLVTFVMPPNL